MPSSGVVPALSRDQAGASVRMRSEVRRWNLFDLEQVKHFRSGQEWVPHWHSEWSIGAIVRGSCLCSVEGRPFQAGCGDLLAIAPGVVHTGALLSAEHTASVLVVMVYVPPHWLAQAGLLPPRASGVTHCQELANAAAQLRTAEEIHRWLVQSMALLADRLSPHAGGSEPGPVTRRLLLEVQEAILAGDTSVTELAQRCSVSRERLHRVVKRWTGMAPADYLRSIRINRARDLLVSGESIASTALACGFADQAHFTRWFRKTFGYTPGDFVTSLSFQTGSR